MLALSFLLACFQPAPSVVLVSLDTLRADRLGPWGGDGLTPNLDAFAAQAVVFQHALAPSNMTSLSHGALFAGRPASTLGPVDHRFTLPDHVPTLARVLGDAGWATAGFVAGGDLAPDTGLGRGFDTWASIRDGGSLAHTAPPALAWQADQDGPHLLLVHGYDAHARYLKPPPFAHAWAPGRPSPLADRTGRSHAQPGWLDGLAWHREGLREHLDLAGFRPWHPEARRALRTQGEADGLATVSATDTAWLTGLYDGGAAWADAWFGLLMAGLAEQGALDEAWVIVFSDHGEALGEDGFFGHVLSLEPAVARVPLMVRPPGGTTGRTVEAAVGLADLMPTVLALAGVPVPDGVDARSLAGELTGGEGLPADRIVFSEGVTGQYLAMSATGGLVASGAPWRAPELPDLLRSSALDGPAFAAWPGTSAAEQARLQQALATWREGLDVSTGPVAPLTDERRRSLQERGYWAADP